MKKINLEAEFKKLITTKGTDKQKMQIAPYRDWRVIIILFFIGLIASFGFNLYISIGINSESFFATAPKTSGVTTFNEAGLAKTIETIKERELKFEAAQTEPMNLVDPSL